MRDRQRILDNLEKLYRTELSRDAGGEGADPGLTVSIDAWESYLDHA